MSCEDFCFLRGASLVENPFGEVVVLRMKAHWYLSPEYFRKHLSSCPRRFELLERPCDKPDIRQKARILS